MRVKILINQRKLIKEMPKQRKNYIKKANNKKRQNVHGKSIRVGFEMLC